MLAANDPTRLARTQADVLRGEGVRFFLSTGPAHSHWFRPSETLAFTRELRGLGLPVEFRSYAVRKGEYAAQLAAGLAFALQA